MFRVLQSEFKGFQGMVKTDQAKRATNSPRGAKNSHGVGGRAQADVPYNKFARVILEPFEQAELAHIKPLRFSNGTNHGVKGLRMRQRMHAMSTVAEFDNAISVGWNHRVNMLETLSLSFRAPRSGPGSESCISVHS